MSLSCAYFIDGMVAGKLDLSQTNMATVVTLSSLVITANSLVTIAMMMSQTLMITSSGG